MRNFYSPLATVPTRNQFARLFDFVPAATAVTTTWSPPVDLEESKEAWLVTADLPGVDPSSISITVDQGVLTLKGERDTRTEDSDAGVTHRRERRSGKFVRKFTLPASANGDAITARSRDGVLTISISKQEEAKPVAIEIEH